MQAFGELSVSNSLEGISVDPVNDRFVFVSYDSIGAFD